MRRESTCTTTRRPSSSLCQCSLRVKRDLTTQMNALYNNNCKSWASIRYLKKRWLYRFPPFNLLMFSLKRKKRISSLKMSSTTTSCSRWTTLSCKKKSGRTSASPISVLKEWRTLSKTSGDKWSKSTSKWVLTLTSSRLNWSRSLWRPMMTWDRKCWPCNWWKDLSKYSKMLDSLSFSDLMTSSSRQAPPLWLNSSLTLFHSTPSRKCSPKIPRRTGLSRPFTKDTFWPTMRKLRRTLPRVWQGTVSLTICLMWRTDTTVT